MRIEKVERVVEDAWQRLQLTFDERQRAEVAITEALEDLSKTQGRQRGEMESRRDDLLAERSKLLVAHNADAIPLSLLKIEQDRIGASLAIVEEQLAGVDANHEKIMGNLAAILNLLQHCRSADLESAPKLGGC